jgi:hypothetical protein
LTGPVYLGNPGELAIRELADHVITSSRSRFFTKPLPVNYPMQGCPGAFLFLRALRRNPAGYAKASSVPLPFSRRTHFL